MSPPDTVREHLEKILASSGFANAERLRRFLRFVVENTLSGNATHLKEYVLGVEVFDRRPDYDPRLEPIVRVEARRLRAKLTKYYETDGLHDLIRIELPTGTYTPVFHDPAVQVVKRESAPNSIAVLPFANRSPEPDSEYIADGLTEELIRVLTKVNRLRVVAWPAAYPARGLDVPQVAEKLGVGTILEGSVRRAGDRLRVTAQLVNIRTGEYIWSETLERELKDIFAVQDEIARSIVAALRPHLGAEPTGLEGITRTRNLEAYSAYLKGRFHWSKRSLDGLTKAVYWFQQAVAADPEYSPAHAGIADAHAILGQYGFEAPGAHMQKAKAAAERALQLDPNCAEAYASLGLVHAVHEFDWKHAEANFLQAIRLNPNYATARHWYGYDYVTPLGRLDEGVEHLRLAQQLDPLSPAVSTALATILSWNRQYDEAEQEFQKTFDLDAESYRAHLGLARMHADQERFGRAIEILEAMPSHSRAYPMTRAVLAHALAASGRHAEAMQLIDQLHEESQRQFVSPFLFARAYAGFPDMERSLEWLEKAWEAKECRLVHIAVAPVFRPLHGHRQFQSLLQRLGLAQARHNSLR